MDSTTSSMNRGYSSENMYWGVHNDDVDTVRSRMSDNQSKEIQDRIDDVEKHFGEICTDLGNYSRKNASLRDKGDLVARSIRNYADHESHNSTTKIALRDFTQNLNGVQDFREIQVKRLENNVVQPLSQYGQKCKQAKTRVKKAFTARKKETKEKKKLDTIRSKRPSDRHNISMAETDLHQASVDASRNSKILEDEMDRFEKQKLQDIKEILLDFVNTEMVFHTKALEMYTRCYHSLTSISEEDDLEEFRNWLRPVANARARMQQMPMQTSGSPMTSSLRSSTGRTSGSRTSLNSTGKSQQSRTSGPKATTNKGRSSGNQPPTAHTYANVQNTGNAMYEDSDEEDDDEEDEDEEEDDSEEETEESEEDTRTSQRQPQTRTQYSMFQAR